MTASADDFRIFRIRMKVDESDYSKDAWEDDKVGIWYGAWEPEDLKNAIALLEKGKKEEALKCMADTPKQKKLGWEYTKSFFDTCRRFKKIEAKKDWVWVYFGDEHELHLGQLKDAEIETDPKSQFKCDGEPFHFRHVINKKKFPLANLPDSYRLLPSAGRGNVHEHNDVYARLLKVLVECDDAKTVQRYYADLKRDNFDKWLDLLSPAEWESLCLGYLIIEHNYVPTGLLPGRTLRDYDVVGKTRDGVKVLAQCKKSPDSYDVTKDFLNDCKNWKDSRKALWFWCSYGGWSAEPSCDIKLVDKKYIKNWLCTERGKQYVDLFGN